MQYVVIFVAGLVVGAGLVFVINRFQRKDMEKSFCALSLDALRKNSTDFLQLANQSLSTQTQAGAGELEGKKKLIDQTLEAMKGDLQKMEKAVAEFDSKREKSFGEINSQLKTTAEQTAKLQETTSRLQAALANTKVRGQWGERMAEDVLKLIGFTEGINYLKQKTQETATTRPDFTFLLPQDLKVNMDVKFPLDNYMKYFNEQAESAKQGYKEQFLRDARLLIKSVTTREYINHEENTVDYVLVFIPSEQVYCFMNESDSSILDDALRSKVILCSPLTLYAMLAVMRQAVDNFNLQKTASQMYSLFGAFNKQWEAFGDCMDKMGKRIEEALKEYDALVTTRRRKLEAPLREIEDLRKQKGIPEAPMVVGPVAEMAIEDMGNP